MARIYLPKLQFNFVHLTNPTFKSKTLLMYNQENYLVNSNMLCGKNVFYLFPLRFGLKEEMGQIQTP